MKKIVYILLFTILTSSLYSQSINYKIILQQYENLDTINYIKKVKELVLISKDENIIPIRNKIVKKINDKNAFFVLKIDIDTSKIFSENFVKIDYCEKKFNLYFFDKSFHPTFLYLENDQLSDFTDCFPTFSSNYAKKLKNAYKQVIKKEPKFLLECFHLPNTLIFAKDEKIYVYRVKQKKVYELSDYVRKFRNDKYFYFDISNK